MTASVIAIGNPGAGKSTILNSLAGEVLFKSGVSIGSGLTYQLDVKENKRGRFYDTPGLSDDTLREEAGKAITKALREGGSFKIIFFVRLEAGRLVKEDVTTFKLVLKSAPEIGNKYGIVTNKLPLPVAKLLQDPEQAGQLLTKLFLNIPEENRCPSSSITYLPYEPKAESINNYLLDLDSLITLHGSYFEDFVHKEIETVKLTKDKARNIVVEEYEESTKLIELLMKRTDEDREWLKEQQKMMIEQNEKAQNEKDERHARDMAQLNVKRRDDQETLDKFRARDEEKMERLRNKKCIVM